MQVVAGTARRILLQTPPGEHTRPTSGRIKETLFNILQPVVQGAAFLDLFAGSGGIGIEALSRGAREAVFIDNSRQAVGCIRDNLERTHLAGKAQVFQTDVLSAIRQLGLRGRRFDLIFVDPPYDGGFEQPVLEAIAQAGILAEDGRIVMEARMQTRLPDLAPLGFSVFREKEYKNNKHIFIGRSSET